MLNQSLAPNPVLSILSVGSRYHHRSGGILNDETMNKYCAKCRAVKDVSEFYKEKSRNDGLQHWCKDCVGKVSALRGKTPAAREIMKKYNKSDRGRERMHKYDISEKGRLASRKSSARERILHPDRVSARQAKSNAVINGTLNPQPCMVCGNEDSQAHHDDYSKPLEVKWFCVTHHWEYHAENASG